MTDYGSDFSCVSDLDPKLSVVSGPLVVAQAIVRRLQTPRGGLWYDLSYGTNVRQWLNGSTSKVRVASAIEAEARKDERVSAARATVTFSQSSMDIRLLITLAEGPFELTIGVNDLTVDLISFQAAA